MAETHPLVEAVARAMCVAQRIDPDADWTNQDGHDPRAAMLEVAIRDEERPIWRTLVPAAIAAARVILSAEPSDAAVWAGCKTNCTSAEPCERCPATVDTNYGLGKQSCRLAAERHIRASNAALLREIEGGNG